MPPPPIPPRREPPDLTRLLNQAAEGDGAAGNELLPLVYEQLRYLARQRMAGERNAHTLQATALVHEAYLRMLGDQPISWPNRARFFWAAGEAMRRILIEHARKRGRVKRGGLQKRVPLSVVDLANEEDPAEVLALDEAIRRLEERDPRMGQVVHLRFYAGLSVLETAEALGLSARTVKRDWTFARAWLYETLGEVAPAPQERDP